jgi:protoporphyrinogen oxidase
LLPIANFRQSPVNVDGFKVAIIGAGAAGLFTAMIFDYLNDRFPGLNVKYELLEGEQERSGGRLFTYKFPQQTDQPKPGPHDYYDVGAMRFPDVKTMRQ